MSFACQRYLLMNSKYYQTDGFEVTIQLRLVRKKEVAMRTKVMCAKRLNATDAILNVFNFQQRVLLFHIISIYNNGSQITSVT